MYFSMWATVVGVDASGKPLPPKDVFCAGATLSLDTAKRLCPELRDTLKYESDIFDHPLVLKKHAFYSIDLFQRCYKNIPHWPRKPRATSVNDTPAILLVSEDMSISRHPEGSPARREMDVIDKKFGFGAETEMHVKTEIALYLDWNIKKKKHKFIIRPDDQENLEIKVNGKPLLHMWFDVVGRQHRYSWGKPAVVKFDEQGRPVLQKYWWKGACYDAETICYKNGQPVVEGGYVDPSVKNEIRTRLDAVLGRFDRWR